jgi:hypothetical protein
MKSIYTQKKVEMRMQRSLVLFVESPTNSNRPQGPILAHVGPACWMELFAIVIDLGTSKPRPKIDHFLPFDLALLVFALAMRLKPSVVANKLGVTFFSNNLFSRF